VTLEYGRADICNAQGRYFGKAIAPPPKHRPEVLRPRVTSRENAVFACCPGFLSPKSDRMTPSVQHRLRAWRWTIWGRLGMELRQLRPGWELCSRLRLPFTHSGDFGALDHYLSLFRGMHRGSAGLLLSVGREQVGGSLQHPTGMPREAHACKDDAASSTATSHKTAVDGRIPCPERRVPVMHARHDPPSRCGYSRDTDRDERAPG
jgi:hypothetical protein